MKLRRLAARFGACIVCLTTWALSSPRCPAATPTPGTLVVVAGNGAWDLSGDGGPAWSAAVNAPLGLAVDASGNLFIADTGNNRIRKVAPDGTLTTCGRRRHELPPRAVRGRRTGARCRAGLSGISRRARV